MTRSILAFGDSNTHGTPPMTSDSHHPRLPRRWPVVLAEVLGETVIEDGLPGRTACPLVSTSADVHLDGHLGLRMALATHGPIDHLLIMLGSNDLKEAAGKTPDMIVAGLAGLMLMAKDTEAQARHGGFEITLIAPPPLLEMGTFVPEMRGGAAKSIALAEGTRALAAAWSAGFIDAGAYIASSPVDGVHFDEDAHAALGRAVAGYLA